MGSCRFWVFSGGRGFRLREVFIVCWLNFVFVIIDLGKFRGFFLLFLGWF